MVQDNPINNSWSIETERLTIRLATPDDDDVGFLLMLWTDGRVMRFVGFPDGLRTDHGKIKAQLEGYGGNEFDRVLIVCLKDSKQTIGECKLGSPNDDKIALTDIKLAPEYWGNGYGREVKQALVDYLFEHTDCFCIESTPNVMNVASIKMQEAVGGKRMAEKLYEFPDEMKEYTIDVPHYVYALLRSDWLERKSELG